MLMRYTSMYGVGMAQQRQSRKERKERRHRAAVESRAAPVTAGFAQADQVRRLTYSRAQAAEALGVSVQTIDRRVVPAITTVKTAWGSRLIPVSELERYLTEHTQLARRPRAESGTRGRPAS